MDDNDFDLNVVAAIVGVIGGVVGIIIAIRSSLPASNLIPICIAIFFLIATPIVVKYATQRLPPTDAPVVRSVSRLLWVVTSFLIVCLIVSHHIWSTIPARIGMAASQPPFTELQVGQFAVLSTQATIPGIFSKPGAAFKEWQRSSDAVKEKVSVEILGVVDRQANGSSLTDTVYVVRMYPAARFFSQHRGPVPIFEYLLGGWLVIFFIGSISITVLLPWLNERMKSFRGGASSK